MQTTLFENEASHDIDGSTAKTYRAIRHDVVRAKQAINCDTVHHPGEKELQIRTFLDGANLSILELFSGSGNCTRIYAEFGKVLSFEKNRKTYANLVERTSDLPLVDTRNEDSYVAFHSLIANKQKYDVVDIDPYGFPSRMFPDVFLLINSGWLFVTMPKPYVNILNGITATHLTSYFGEKNPGIEAIVERIALWGLCHWREVVLLNCIDLKSVWRMAFKVEKVKATDYTGVRNR